MTPSDGSDTADDPELTPDQDRAVSDLLGALRDEPQRMPSDVGDRLDEVLVGLAAERPATRRTARRWPAVLVAAAAVSVLGVGIGTVLEDTGDSGSASHPAAGSAAEKDAGSSPQGLTDDGGGASSSDKAPTDARKNLTGDSTTVREGLASLRSDSLTVDAQRLADFALFTTTEARLFALPSGRCDVPEAARDEEVFGVRLDRRPATIVFRAEDDGVRQADVYACSDGTNAVATAFVTTPAPR